MSCWTTSGPRFPTALRPAAAVTLAAHLDKLDEEQLLPTASSAQLSKGSSGERPTSRRENSPQRARAPLRWTSPFPPIADYGFLSDCHTGALVSSDGSIEWMCLPHFDSPSIFGAMLDRGAGSWRVGPYGLYVPAGRRYIPGTNIIETTWMTPQGWLRVVDALTIGPWHDNKHGSSHTRPPTDYDADHLVVRIDRMHPGPGPGRDRVRADARLRRHAGALVGRTDRRGGPSAPWTPPTT